MEERSFFSGVGLLIFVPVFKTLTHLPPFMGMMLALGLMWVITMLHKDKPEETREKISVAKALQKVDSPVFSFSWVFCWLFPPLSLQGY